MDPNRITLEEIKQGRETLNRLAEEAGRDPRSIEVVAFGSAGRYRDRESVKDLEQAGADRVTIWVENAEGDGALEEMEQIAKALL